MDPVTTVTLQRWERAMANATHGPFRVRTSTTYECPRCGFIGSVKDVEHAPKRCPSCQYPEQQHPGWHKRGGEGMSDDYR